jgi:hypothetical protein
MYLPSAVGVSTNAAGTAEYQSQASSTLDGWLSHTDWNTFNSKQAALTNPVTGPGSGAAAGDIATCNNTGCTSIADSGIAASNVLKADGTVTGATSQAQSFTDGVTIGSNSTLAGTTANPSLTVSTGVWRFYDKANRTNALEIGIYPGSPWGAWFQGTNQPISAGGAYPIAINPLGGYVALGGSGSSVTASNGTSQEAICLADGTGCPSTVPVYTGTATAGSWGTGVVSVDCVTATCTNVRGTYTIGSGTFTVGTVFALTWPATPTAYVCSVTQNGYVGGGLATVYYGVGHTTATTTGMSITIGVTPSATVFNIDYSCQP